MAASYNFNLFPLILESNIRSFFASAKSDFRVLNAEAWFCTASFKADFDSLMIAFSRRKVEVRRSRRVENDLRDFEIEFWSRVVAEEGKMRTHTRAEIQPIIS